MPWRAESIRKRLFLVGMIAATLLFTHALAGPVSATDNNVSAVICGDDATGASIDVTQPNDDSIVTQPTTTFRGTVTNATQIEVKVDGQYTATLAVGFNQATFMVDLTLAEGTHTVMFTANDICLVADASDNVVITYQAATEPSDGGSVPTDVGEGTVVGAGDDETDTEQVSKNGWSRSIPVIGEPIDDLIGNIVRAAGIDDAVKGESPVVGIMRIGLTVVALSTVVMAGAIAPTVMQVSSGLWGIFGTSGRTPRRIVTWSIRIGGVLLLAIAYFI